MSSSKVLWWIAGGVVGIVGVAAVGIFGWGVLTTQTTTQAKTYRQPITALHVDGDAASVSVTAGAPNQVLTRRAAEVTQGWTPTVTEAWSGTVLRVTLRCPSSVFGRKCRIAYDVTVPPGTVVDVRTDSGKLAVRDLSGKVTMSTSSGELRASGLSGPLTVRADSGEIKATALRSPNVHVTADSGSVALGFSAPPKSVNVSVDSGSVGITVPRTGTPADIYAVQVAVNSGQRAIEVQQGSGAKISVSADSGDVKVGYQR